MTFLKVGAGVIAGAVVASIVALALWPAPIECQAPKPPLPMNDVVAMAARLYAVAKHENRWDALSTGINVRGDGQIEVRIELPNGSDLRASGATMDEVLRVLRGESADVAKALAP